MNSNKLNYLSSNEPTYWPTDPNKLPDLLDFFVIKNIAPRYTKISSLIKLTLHHAPALQLLIYRLLNTCQTDKFTTNLQTGKNLAKPSTHPDQPLAVKNREWYRRSSGLFQPQHNKYYSFLFTQSGIHKKSTQSGLHKEKNLRKT